MAQNLYYKINGQKKKFHAPPAKPKASDIQEAAESVFDSHKSELVGSGCEYKDVEFTVTNNSFWNTQNTTVIATSYTGQYKRVSAIPVSVGDEIHIELDVGSSSKTSFLVIVDADYNKIEEITRRVSNTMITTFVRDVKITNANAKYILLTVFGTKIPIIKKKVFKAENILANKYVSFIGDSFCSFSGTLPSGNKAFYDGGAYGVACKEQMWWNILANKLGMNPLIVNGWSGSTVAKDVRDETVYKCGSDTSRCENLDDGTHNPNVIIVSLGLNDYSYNGTLGTYDGTTDLNDDVSTYRSAYATMLKRIKTKYPSALVVCLTPWFAMRGTDKGYSYINNNNVSLYSFVKATEEIAHLFGCETIDVYTLFNKSKYYGTYCEDSETTPTHPNSLGHKVIGISVANELKRIANASILNA